MVPCNALVYNIYANKLNTALILEMISVKDINDRILNRNTAASIVIVRTCYLASYPSSFQEPGHDTTGYKYSLMVTICLPNLVLGARRLRVWSRDCVLHSTSELLDSVEQSLHWRYLYLL